MTALERNGFPYKVVIAAMGVLGGAMGVIINTNGILFAAVIRDMGFRAGDLSVDYTILYLVSALSVTFTSRWFFTARHRVVMAALGTLYTAPFAAMCLYSRLWHWYAAAAVSGFGYSCMLVSVTTALNNWFAARRGMVAGVALSASGVTGALLAPVFARCIQAFGWRPTALLIGALAFMLIVPAGAFWLIPDPSECGRRPWGEAPAAESEVPHTALSVPGYVFVLCMIALAGTNALFQFNLQLPLFARSLDWSLAAGAAL
ncbi:MAG: MFS transporter, partial [Pyramidobacter sp.]|nr:MFS transporter [Pyramidobacter sp.]